MAMLGIKLSVVVSGGEASVRPRLQHKSTVGRGGPGGTEVGVI